MMKRYFFVLLIGSLLMSACGPVPPVVIPTPSLDAPGVSIVPTLAPVITPLATVTLPLIENNIIPQPILLFFLLDSSKSVIGAGTSIKCDPPSQESSTPIHRKSLMYFLKLLGGLNSDSLSSLHIGIARFGGRYEEHYYRGDEINGKYSEIYQFVTGDPNIDSSTNYVEGLWNSFNSMKEYSSKKLIWEQHLILLTDGFRAEVDEDAVETQLANLNQSSIRLHVGLICPEKGDTSFWVEHGLDVWYGGASYWISAILDILKKGQILPSQSGWIEGPGATSIQFLGYAKSVRIYYYEFEDNTYHYVNTSVNSKAIKSDLPFELTITPDTQCNLANFSLSLQTNLDRGFWWADYDLPSLPRIVLDFPEHGNNTDPVLITAHLDIQGMREGQLSNWRECFSSLSLSSFNTKNNSWEVIKNLEIQPCSDGGSGLCPEKGGNSLFRVWKWTPNYDLPQKVELVASWNQVLSNYVRTDVKFKPIIKESPIVAFHQTTNSQDPEELEITIRVNYDVAEPDVYVLVDSAFDLSVQTKNVQKEYADYACPSSDGLLDSGKYNFNIVSQSLPLKDSFIFFSDEVVGASDHLYKVKLYKYIFSICKFSIIRFVWHENNDALSSTSEWRCIWQEETSILACQEP